MNNEIKQTRDMFPESQPAPKIGLSERIRVGREAGKINAKFMPVGDPEFVEAVNIVFEEGSRKKFDAILTRYLEGADPALKNLNALKERLSIID